MEYLEIDLKGKKKSSQSPYMYREIGEKLI